MVSGSEILEEWKGKRVSMKLAGRSSIFRGEIIRSDAVGLLLAVEGNLERTTEGGWVGLEANEDSSPSFSFVPWAQIEMVIPQPGELP
jgi:hypothetical protein